MKDSPDRCAAPLPLAVFCSLMLGVPILFGCPVMHTEVSLFLPGEPREARGVLAGDEVWSGEVRVVDDLLVPAGRTLRILPGTTVRFVPADTTRTEPEFLDNGTEILVRGRLIAEGAADAVITFGPDGESPDREERSVGGIIFDGGEGSLRHCRIEGAEYGLLLLSSSPTVRDVEITGVRHGVMLYGTSKPLLEGVKVEAEDGGLLTWDGTAPSIRKSRFVSREREGIIAGPGSAPSLEESYAQGPLGGVLWGTGRGPAPVMGEGKTTVASVSGLSPPPERWLPFDLPGADRTAGTNRAYRGENFIGRDDVWEGGIFIDGTVMVGPGARLTIRPGTTVRFAFLDSNGDGIGESGIFVQGLLRAEGEPDRPIVFTADGRQGPGRWGAVNIMGSDTAENLLSHCLIESSYRGLHSHFSRFRVERSIFRNNYRSLQFQESTAVIEQTLVTGSRSGLRFRDSTVVIENCRITGNTIALQTLRSRLSLASTGVVGNTLAGVHMRETEGVLSGNTVAGNAPGLRATGGRFRLEENLFEGNGYGGLLLQGSEAKITGNRVAGNGGNGLFVDSQSVTLRENTFTGNLRFALENNAPSPVDAARNFWGVAPEEMAEVIYDRQDDGSVGPVLVEPLLQGPPPFRSR